MFDVKRRRIGPMIVFLWSSPLIRSLQYDKKIACSLLTIAQIGKYDVASAAPRGDSAEKQALTCGER